MSGWVSTELIMHNLGLVSVQHLRCWPGCWLLWHLQLHHRCLSAGCKLSCSLLAARRSL